MQKRSKFSQVSMIAISIVLLTSSLVLANLEIQTNMENAVQTIKRVIITDDGTASGTHLVEINANGSGVVQIGQAGDIETKLKVQGNIEAGERNNQADGQYASVIGGDGNKAIGEQSTVAGGTNNIAEGLNSTIAGGTANITSGFDSTIVGGRENIITANGEKSTIGGGKNNIANAHFSSIPGGVNNETNADYTFAAGFNAKANHVGSFVRSDYDLFGGDFTTTADRQFLIRATNGVGINTNAPGAAIQVVGSAIFGDEGNTATGTHSFAAGNRAKVLHDGSFVRADNQSADFASTDTNQFLIRAESGVGINTNNPQYGALQIKGAGNAGGVTLYRGAGNTARMYINSDDNFHIVRGASDTQGITIKPNGNVGIGDDTPDGTLKLDVAGDVGANKYCDSNGNHCSTATEIETTTAAANKNIYTCGFTAYHAGTNTRAGRVYISYPAGTIAQSRSDLPTNNNGDEIKVSSNSCYDNNVISKIRTCVLGGIRKNTTTNSPSTCRIGHDSAGWYIDHMSTDNGDYCYATCMRIE